MLWHINNVDNQHAFKIAEYDDLTEPSIPLLSVISLHVPTHIQGLHLWSYNALQHWLTATNASPVIH